MIVRDMVRVMALSSTCGTVFACAKHFKVDPQKMKVVPLEPPVTRQSLRSGEVAAGTTDSSPDIDLVNDKANYEVVCVDPELPGCDGSPDTLACRRSPVIVIRGKAGGGTKTVIVN